MDTNLFIEQLKNQLSKFIPYLMVIGVSKVKIAVDKIPIDNVYFPPYFAANIAPGIWRIV